MCLRQILACANPPKYATLLCDTVKYISRTMLSKDLSRCLFNLLNLFEPITSEFRIKIIRTSEIQNRLLQTILFKSSWDTVVL